MESKRFMPQYTQDPRWLNARFTSTCGNEKCGNAIKKNDRIFYYPSSRTALCPTCGETASAEFQSAKFDESVLTGNW